MIDSIMNLIDSIMNLIDSILTLKFFFLLQLLRIIVKKLILRKKANYKRIGLRSDIGTRKKSCFKVNLARETCNLARETNFHWKSFLRFDSAHFGIKIDLYKKKKIFFEFFS
jgi:hypothetical protein